MRAPAEGRDRGLAGQPAGNALRTRLCSHAPTLAHRHTFAYANREGFLRHFLRPRRYPETRSLRAVPGG